MDSAIEEGFGFAVLGEFDFGYVGGIVYGGGGDLWGGYFYSLLGEILIICKIGNIGIL